MVCGIFFNLYKFTYTQFIGHTYYRIIMGFYIIKIAKAVCLILIASSGVMYNSDSRYKSNAKYLLISAIVIVALLIISHITAGLLFM